MATEFISQFIAFSAPSGAGKTTIVRKLEEKYAQMVISVSATTRPPRPGEKHGYDYYFMSREEFEQAIAGSRFLEYEEVHGNYYGTLTETVETFYRQGKVVLFDIDVKGAKAVKRRYPQAVLIFIKPPDEQELINRLKKRKSETEQTINKRLQRLAFEYKQAEDFDFTVVNADLDETLRMIEQIIIKK